LLVVIVITNIHLRGVWSFVVIVLIVFAVVVLSLTVIGWSANAQPIGDLGWSTLANRRGASVDFPGGLFTRQVNADGKMMAITTAGGQSRFELFMIRKL